MKIKKINGYPLGIDTLDEMQRAYSLFNALGEIAGDKAIIKGCTADREGNVSDGVVYVNGEVLEFRGGPKQATVVIKQDVTSKVFENGQQHQVLYKRYLTFGSGLAALYWNGFKRDQRFVRRFADLKAEISDKLAGKAPLEHRHDDRYYTHDQVDGFFEGEREGKKQLHWDRVMEKLILYPPAPHQHDDYYDTQSQVDGFFEGECEGGKQLHWDRVMEEPAFYPPASHDHDDQYLRKGQLKAYGYLTEVVYIEVDTFFITPKDFGMTDRVISYIKINKVVHTGISIKILSTFGFSKIKITK